MIQIIVPPLMRSTYECLVETMKVAVTEVVMVLMEPDKRFQREVPIIANRWTELLTEVGIVLDVYWQPLCSYADLC